MPGPLEVFRLELTVYGALHVGTGENYPAYAYVPDRRNGRVILFDTNKALQLLGEKERREFIQRVADNPKRAQSSLAAYWQRDPERLTPALIREVEASPAFFGTVEKADSDLAALEFRPLPVSLQGPYLPGSSVKGALRTAWLAELTGNELERHHLVGSQSGWERRSHGGSEGRLALRQGTRPSLSLAQNLEALLLDNLNQHQQADLTRDPFRALRLSDSAPLRQTRLERLGVMHENPQKRMNVIVLAETVPDLAKVSLELRFHRGLTERQGPRLAGVSGEVAPDKLAEAARYFYEHIIELEYEFAEDLRLENQQQTYEDMLAALEGDPDLFPLRLGFGSGKFATTLADFMNEPETKTRKTAGSQDPRGGVPLGWVLAKLASL